MMSVGAVLFGAQSLEVAGLIEAVEDAKRCIQVGSGTMDDDPVIAFGLDHDLVIRCRGR